MFRGGIGIFKEKFTGLPFHSHDGTRPRRKSFRPFFSLCAQALYGAELTSEISQSSKEYAAKTTPYMESISTLTWTLRRFETSTRKEAPPGTRHRPLNTHGPGLQSISASGMSTLRYHRCPDLTTCTPGMSSRHNDPQSRPRKSPLSKAEEKSPQGRLRRAPSVGSRELW